MSDFYAEFKCKTCVEETTQHLCSDDTPTRHLYTVTCTKCGRTPIRGVYYSKLAELLKLDGWDNA